MKVLSIIVPSYNSAGFLDTCIPSLLAEKVMDQLDIIIVNDGSADATEKVAEKYCRQYPTSIRLLSQENKGHGGALNTGFAAAVGKYLRPIDADDWVETQNLPLFIDFLKDCNSDVVLTHYNTVDVVSGEISRMKSYPAEFGKAITMEELMVGWRGFYRAATFHGITYRTEFYRKYGISLSEHMFYEDNEYATFPFCHASTVTPLDLFVYDYRVGDINQSVSIANQVKRLNHIETVILRMIREHNNLPEGAGRRYAVMKIQAVVMMYLTTALLAHPDRTVGRRLGKKLMDVCWTDAPEIYRMLLYKYRIYKILSRLHVSKSTWDSFLRSDLYNFLRGNRNFY